MSADTASTTRFELAVASLIGLLVVTASWLASTSPERAPAGTDPRMAACENAAFALSRLAADVRQAAEIRAPGFTLVRQAPPLFLHRSPTESTGFLDLRREPIWPHGNSPGLTSTLERVVYFLDRPRPGPTASTAAAATSPTRSLEGTPLTTGTRGGAAWVLYRRQDTMPRPDGTGGTGIVETILTGVTWLTFHRTPHDPFKGLDGQGTGPDVLWIALEVASSVPGDPPVRFTSCAVVRGRPWRAGRLAP